MDIKQLRIFILVAETGSLSRASERMRLAQPALSRQIRLLEEEIGFELFYRSGRGMALTELGTTLLERVSGPVAELDNSLEDVRSLAVSEPIGRVVLGCIPSVSRILASRLAIRVAKELPSVSFKILEGYGGHLIDWLHRGDADMALLYGPATDLHLRVSDVMFEELVLVSPKTKFGGVKALPVIAISDLQMVLPSRPHGLRQVVEVAAARAGTTINVKYEADSFHVLKALVAAGMGHTILPLSAFYLEKASDRFHITRLEKPRISRQIVMARPISRGDTKATAAVREMALDEIRQLQASGEWQAYPEL